MQVNIVTPSGIVYTHRAHQIDVKTDMGGLTILPNHCPIVTSLAIGPVTVTRINDQGKQNYIAVNGGILEFSHNVCNIIADTAERGKNIDRQRAELAKERAEKELHEAEERHDLDEIRRARIALNKAVNRIGVSNRFRKG